MEQHERLFRSRSGDCYSRLFGDALRNIYLGCFSAEGDLISFDYAPNTGQPSAARHRKFHLRRGRSPEEREGPAQRHDHLPARDGFGQLWKEISPDRGTTTYAHLGDGLLDTMTRGNGVQSAYQFDGLGRLAKLTAAGQSETFTYDLCTNGIGRLCSATSPGTTLSYAYEPDGRVRTRKDQITLAGVQSIYTTSYAYDTVGRLSKLTYPNGEAATYAYSIGQPSAMTMTVGGVAKNMVSGASYEPSGRLSGYTHGNGLVRDYVFDLDGRTSAITSKNGAAAVQSLSYLYDKEDRITTITNPLPNYGESYGYDALSRLTSATGAGYTYDANGNRLTALPNGSVFTYVPGSNRIATVSDIFIAPDGSIVTGDPPAPDYVSSFTYDGAGNITKWDFPATLTATYTYDPFNRMSAVLDTTAGSKTVGQYGYNTYGERTSKRDLTHGNNYAFVYGEDHELIGERENGAWTNYVWFAGELVGMTRASAIYQIDNDHLGRPELITNANKAVVWQSNNDPFGGMNPTMNTLGEFNIGLPGQYFDAESNYWYNMNRYYVPAIGRYLQADPVGLAGGTNPFAYVGENPANSIDPTGLTGELVGAGCVLTIEAGCVPGAVVGAIAESAIYVGAAILIASPIIMNSKPPKDAVDPNGAKAPGEPGDAEGYCPAKDGPKWVANPNGSGNGWEDENGNVWVPTGPGGAAHGGPHWDVQTPGGGHINVYPGGRKR
jgi:RHS repeat-associated protein